MLQQVQGPGKGVDGNLLYCCSASGLQSLIECMSFPVLARYLSPFLKVFPFFSLLLTVIIAQWSKITDLHPKKQVCYKLLWSQLCSVCYRPCACIWSTEGAIKILVTADDPLGRGDGQEQEEFRLGQNKQWTTSHWDWTQLWGVSFFQVCLPESLSSRNRWKLTTRYPWNLFVRWIKHLVGAHPERALAQVEQARLGSDAVLKEAQSVQVHLSNFDSPRRADGLCLHS